MLPIATNARSIAFLFGDDGDIDFSSIENEFRQDVPSDTYLKSIMNTFQRERKTTDTSSIDILESIPFEELNPATKEGQQIISDNEDDLPIEAFPEKDLQYNHDVLLQQQPTSSQSDCVSFNSLLSVRDLSPTKTPLSILTRHNGDTTKSFLSVKQMENIFSDAASPIKDCDSRDRTRFRDYQKEKWEKRYNELTQVFRYTGRSSVHHTDISKKGLARWIKRQRAQ